MTTEQVKIDNGKVERYISTHFIETEKYIKSDKTYMYATHWMLFESLSVQIKFVNNCSSAFCISFWISILAVRSPKGSKRLSHYKQSHRTSRCPLQKKRYRLIFVNKSQWVCLAHWVPSLLRGTESQIAMS